MKTGPPPAVLADRYRLETVVGASATGTVWLATDEVLARAVNVTVVDPDALDATGSRERLFENAGALAATTPVRMVRLLDVGVDGEVVYVVSEQVSGRTLAEILRDEGRLPPDRACSMVAEVLDALTEAHAAGVLHLDLAPENVVIDPDGRVRVRNAGIAQIALGRAGFERAMPPEAPAVDTRSDVWCAGALLLELLTGRREDLEPDRADVPTAVRPVLARSLAPDAASRYPDARAMATDLRSAVALPTPPAGGPRSRFFRTWLAVPLLVALATAVIVGAGAWLGRLELGGPIGVRILTSPAAPAPAATPLPVAGISVLDPPPGDGHENDDDLPLAIDGDLATVWRSENYFDGTLNKPGVGLLLDLGREATVGGFRLDAPAPGFTFTFVVGNDPSAMVGDARTAATRTAPDSAHGLQPQTGRYALVWITSVVSLSDGSHRAEVSEIRILGAS